MALLEGRFEEAERLVHEAAALNPRAGDPGAGQGYRVQLYALRQEQGRLEELRPYVDSVVEREPAVPAWGAALAFIDSELGRAEPARDRFEGLAADHFAGLPRDGLWLTGMVYLVRVCTYVGDAARAEILHEQLRPYADRSVVVTLGTACLGSVSLYLGMLDATMASWERAEGHFEAALAMHDRLRAPPWIAHTRFEHARMLLDRAGPADRRRADALLDEALDTGRALGMTRLVQRASAAR